MGHALEGRLVEHLPIFHGSGGNGKGAFVEAVLCALGDYADAADPDLLTARTFDATPPASLICSAGAWRCCMRATRAGSCLPPAT